MIKSFTIRDKDRELVLKISCNNKGEYDLIRRDDVYDLKLEARNEKNQKIYFPK